MYHTIYMCNTVECRAQSVKYTMRFFFLPTTFLSLSLSLSHTHTHSLSLSLSLLLNLLLIYPSFCVCVFVKKLFSYSPIHRFGGDTFPPLVLFKVFTSTSSVRGVAGGGVQYISGRRFIKPASEAAEDSRRQMGNRKFYDQMLLDACHHHQLKVTDEVDVTTMKEYMQYAANVDESPAYLGGKENSWRKLNLDGELNHHCIVQTTHVYV